jgi:metal-sulfur cluster biosynthetic enzyme
MVASASKNTIQIIVLQLNTATVVDSIFTRYTGCPLTILILSRVEAKVGGGGDDNIRIL